MIVSQARITAARIFFWWEAPRAVDRFSPTLSGLLADSRYLLAWPRAAALIPASALTLGTLLGLVHSGKVYSGSFAVLILVIALGATGATAGMWFLIGYLPVDLLVHPVWTPEVSRLGLLIADLVLGLLLVVIAASSRRLRLELLIHLSSRQARGGVLSKLPLRMLDATSAAAVYMMLVWAWLQSVPALVRPVAVWAGGQLDASDVAPVQDNILTLTVLSGIAAVVASGLESRGSQALGGSVRRRQGDDQVDLPYAARDARSYPSRIVYPLRAACGVAIAAGLFTDVWQALILWAVLIVGQIAQARAGRSVEWNSRTTRLPVAVRLFIVLVGTIAVGAVILPPLFDEAESLLPVLAVTVVGLALAAIALPRPETSSIPNRGKS